MSSHSSARRRKSQQLRQLSVIDVQDKQTVMPYDENLLERARTQWQFGDWLSLVGLERESIQHHPDRAKLALLAAAGQFQEGRAEEARQYIRLAQDWGCSEQLVMQLLAAGVHNSLGRATAQAGDCPRALRHFENAIRLGAPGSDARLMLRARTHEQFTQLGLEQPDTTDELRQVSDSVVTAPVFRFKHVQQESPLPVDIFFSEKVGDRSRALEAVRHSLPGNLEGELPPTMDWVAVEHRAKTYYFAHVSGDYIPKKMADKGQFYEAPFLNLLARIHQPGKLIVDGGANIGNHSIFFAGVMGGPVIAFEPQPLNHGCLVANVHLNHLSDKVDVRQIALGELEGSIQLVQALEGNYGSFTANASSADLAKGIAVDRQRFSVAVSTLDAQLAGYEDAVSIIKLDLEGMELDALRGARKVIEKSLPVVAVECFTRSLYQEIKTFLQGWDYFVIDSTNATPTFIFLTRRSPQHLDMLSTYLEKASMGKFSSNSVFNDS